MDTATSPKIKFTRQPTEGGVLGQSLPVYDVHADGEWIGTIAQRLRPVRGLNVMYATAYAKEWRLRLPGLGNGRTSGTYTNLNAAKDAAKEATR